MPAKDGDIVTLRVGRNTMSVETVVSDKARIQGLSGRRSMPRAHGMFFVFDAQAIYSMWMNKMLFPLDIVWLDNQLRVVSIVRGCMPCRPGSACPNYSSVAPARYAIEMNAGDAEALGFYEGLAVRTV